MTVTAVAKKKKRGARVTWGRIRKYRSGNFAAQYDDALGNTITAPFVFTNREHAKAWLHEQRVLFETGKLASNQREIKEATEKGANSTLAEFAAEWREERRDPKGRPLKPRTKSEYERLIKTPLAPLANRPIASITALDVQKWIKDYRAKSKLNHPDPERGENQASKAYSHLKTLMSESVLLGLRTTNPCQLRGASNYVSPTKQTDEKVPDRSQVEAMLEHAPAHLKALIELAAWGGFRRGEILELRRKDLEVITENQEVVTGANGLPLYQVRIDRAAVLMGDTVEVGTPKTQQSRRQILMPERSSPIIEAHLALMPNDPEALLFPWHSPDGLNWKEHYTTTKFYDAWQRLRKPSGYDGTFHSLRAFALTVYGETGATLAQIMRRGGHTVVETAMRYQRKVTSDVNNIKLLG